MPSIKSSLLNVLKSDIRGDAQLINRTSEVPGSRRLSAPLHRATELCILSFLINYLLIKDLRFNCREKIIIDSWAGAV